MKIPIEYRFKLNSAASA